MNISKYIELLRFYITDKIGQINESVQDSIGNEIEEILSSLLSAVFSLYISSELILLNGFWGIVLKIVIIVILYFLLKYLIKKLRRYRKSSKEETDADDGKITRTDAKSLVDKFDHIACDGILLSRDYFQKYDNIKVGKADNERLFYLFEAFYYYKKALQIAALVVQYPESCFNNVNNLNGISMYRFVNVYNSLKEIEEVLNESIKNEKQIEYHSELSKEMIDTQDKLNTLKSYIDGVENN